ncbi:MAG: hypothetical protein JXR95_09865 [Deltaproteobacteria bacterium]|nr:hypothetical protein [Deltaproteobacteria bacterium]
MIPVMLPFPDIYNIDVFLFSVATQKRVPTVSETVPSIGTERTDFFIRKILDIYFEGKEPGIEIKRNDEGKVLVNLENIHFSVSHADDSTLISVSSTKSGCDIEKIRHLVRERTFDTRFLDDTVNCPWIVRSGNNLMRIVSAREAALKYFGGKLLNDFKDIHMDFHGNIDGLYSWKATLGKNSCTVGEFYDDDLTINVAYTDSTPTINLTIHRNYFSI